MRSPKPNDMMKPTFSSTWTMRFAWLNVIALIVFSLSSFLVVQFDWRRAQHVESSLTHRLFREPRVMFYFFVCFVSLSWLVGFFALGFVQQVSTTASSSKDLATLKNEVVAPRTKSSAPQKRPKKRRVAILGGTGLVGRALALRLQSHPTMELGALIGSPDTAGKPLRLVWERKEAVLQSRYGEMWSPLPFPPELDSSVVNSFDDVFAMDKSNLVVISCIAPALGWMEEKLLDSQVSVYSISPYARDRVPLVVPEVNYAALRRTASFGLFKSPNCVSCGVSIVLDAMRSAFGKIDCASITTFQSLSGRGDALYNADLVVGNVLPLGGTEEDTNNKIRDEVSSVLGEPDLRISVTAQRVFTQRGHYVDVRLKLARKPSSPAEVKDALERYAPLAVFGEGTLPDSPRQPIKVDLSPRWPRPVQAIEQGEKDGDLGMAVRVGHVSTEDRVFDVTLSLVVDNVARGAYGAALLTAQVHWEMQRQSAAA